MTRFGRLGLVMLTTLLAGAAAHAQGAPDWGRLNVPEATLIDQNGLRWRLADLLRARPVAIGSFFTGCSSICSLLVPNLERLRQLAGPGAAVVAISVDPDNDTPERLAEYARARELGLTLLTGNPATVRRTLNGLGLGGAGNPRDHGQVVLLGDTRTRRFTYRDGLGEPEALTRTLTAAGRATDESARYFGNMVLVDQHGNRLRFYDDVLKDRLVLATFVFTGCGTTCPLVTDTLRQVHTALGPDAGKVRFVAITVDPDNDSPEQLITFAKLHSLPENMLLLGGEPANVRRASSGLGGCDPSRSASAPCLDRPEDHLSVLLIGDVAAVHWQKLPAAASPGQIVDVLRRNFLPESKN